MIKNKNKAEEYYENLSAKEKKKLADVVSYIKGQNHPLDTKEICDIFDKLDVDGEGAISFQDMRNFLSVLRSTVNNYYINEIMKTYDKSGTGLISKAEFMEKMQESLKGKYKKDDITELKEVFQLFDANHDNKIDYQDINSVMCVLGETNFTEKMCKDMINHLSLKKRKGKSITMTNAKGNNEPKEDELELNEDGDDDLIDDLNSYLTYDEFVDIIKNEAEY